MDEPIRAKAWRIPPAQPAILMLFVCAIAVLNVYGHPSAAIRVLTLLLAAGLIGIVIANLRTYMVADDEGVAIRFLGREQWLPWDEISRIEVVSGVRGSNTVRLTRSDGLHVNVPPSLLQPTRPTNVVAAHALLKEVVRDLETIRGQT
jgi:hypothetical protein